MTTNLITRFFSEAMAQAEKAFKAGEVPVGAVLVVDDKVIARGANQVVALKDPTAHAEMVALRQAASELGNERLPGSELFVTLEPCTMCTGALLLARVKKVHFLLRDDKLPALRQVSEMPGHNHRLAWQHHQLPGIDAAGLLSRFFEERRHRQTV